MPRHLIVGSGIAALSAAEAIRARDTASRITLVSAESHPFYSRPGLAYLLAGDVPARQLALRTPDEVRRLMLERIAATAVGVDTAAHELLLGDGRRFPYDRLLLATGAASIAPDFEGAALPGVARLDGLDDAKALLAAKRGSTAVVIGGGSTALELVEGLHARGVRTHYLMRGDRYWSRVLDPVESDLVEQRLEAEGVTLHHRTEVRRAYGNGALAGVETTSGERIACTVLAVAIGVRPRLELAHAAGLATGRGIITNEYLETSAPDVFAAGDVAQVRDAAGGAPMLDTLWASARAMGTVAGANMAGHRVAYRRDAPMNVTRVAGLTTTIVGAVGGAEDPDLLTITRGQSDRWMTDTGSWTISDEHTGDRIRVLVGDRTVVGAIVMGDQRLSRPLARLVADRIDVAALRPALEARPHAGLALLTEFLAAREREDARPA